VGSGFVTLTVNDAAIATNGQALNLINGTVNATFGSVSSSGGLLNNVRLVTIAGTVDLGSGALTGAGSGVAFVVNGGTGAITYGGSITAGVPVDIQSHSVGNITLSGALSSNGTKYGDQHRQQHERHDCLERRQQSRDLGSQSRRDVD
jgi:hypothetical protein